MVEERFWDDYLQVKVMSECKYRAVSSETLNQGLWTSGLVVMVVPILTFLKNRNEKPRD